MSRACKDCRADISGRPGALRCLDCAVKPRPRIASEGRSRSGMFTKLLIDGAHHCRACRVLMPASKTSGPGSVRCHACTVTRRDAMKAVRQAAAKALAAAIRCGELPRPQLLRCTDCAEPATCYDHRDYTKPTTVEPVCRSCNVVRGHADVWPAAVAGLVFDGVQP
jgi:hypothetical protein